MRMLLMISNDHMSLRELYSAVLDSHPAGWGTSFMSGMPAGVESIVSGYDVVIYELGAADSPDRVAAVQALCKAGAVVITHLEGRQAAQRGEELQAAGAYLVANPLSGARIAEVLDTVAAKLRGGKGAAGHVGVRERFRRFFSS